MLREEFIGQLKRLGAICPKAHRFMSGDEERDYITELERRFLHLPAHIWKAVVTNIIDHHKTKALPSSAEFHEAVQFLYKTVVSKEELAKCPMCKGCAMVWVKMRRLDGDCEIVDAVRPCVDCRPDTRRWKVKDGWEEMTTRPPVECETV